MGKAETIVYNALANKEMKIKSLIATCTGTGVEKQE
jgi:hypothetical protein